MHWRASCTADRRADLVAALTETVPLSQSHHETLQALRKWKLEGRAKPASTDEPPPTDESRRKIDVPEG